MIRTPRGRRREARSRIPVLEKTFSTAAETAPSTTVAVVAQSRTSDDSTLVHYTASLDLAWLSCLPSTSVSSVYLVLYVEDFFDYILFFTF